MELIGRIVLILAAVASPWAFGSVTPEPRWFLCLALGGLLVWRLAESLLASHEQPLHIPVAALSALGLLLIAAAQLLPRSEAPVRQMEHAIFADWTDELSIEGPLVGTVSPVTTRTQAAQLFFGFTAFLLSSVWFSSPHSQRWLWGLLAINGAALGFFGIVQRLTWNGMLFWQVPLRFGGTPFASYVNRNNAAGYLNLCLAAGLGWLLLTLGSGRSLRLSPQGGGRRRLPLKVRVLSWIASIDGPEVGVLGLIIVMSAAVLFSLSRGGILAGLIALLSAIILARRVSQRGEGQGSWWGAAAVAMLAGSAAVGLLLWLEGWQLVGDRLTSLTNPFSAAQGRLLHWWDTSGAVLDFPLLGTGFGTYRYANLPYQAHATDAWYVNADNHYFEMLVETGSLGLMCYVGGFVLTGLAAIFLLKQAEVSFRAAGMVGASAVVSQAVQAVTDFGLSIPANGLTFSVISGAICGMACAAADYEQFRVSAWLSLVRLERRGSHVFVNLVLAATAGLFGIEMYGATQSALARNTVIDILPHRPLDTNIDLIVDARVKAAAALQLRPDDAELHRAAALRWIDQFRLQAFREIRGPLGELPAHRVREVWLSTSLPILHERVAAIEATGNNDQMSAIRRIPTIEENLVPAYRHLVEASRISPLMRGNPSLLLYLSILQNPSDLGDDPDATVEGYIKAALFLGPSTPDDLLKTGLLAHSLGRIELSQAALGRCLGLSDDRREAAWSVLIQQATVDELLDGVIPNRLDVLVALAEMSSDAETREKLAAQGEKLVTGAEFGEFTENSLILLARLSEVQGQSEEAIALYRRAVQMAPKTIETRLMMARLLKREGHLQQAEEEYSLLRILAPTRKDIETELRELRFEVEIGNDGR